MSNSIRFPLAVVWTVFLSLAAQHLFGQSLPALSIRDVSLFEGQAGATKAVFVVSLSPMATQSVQIAYATVNDSALATTDYVATNGVLTFAPGQTNVAIEVSINGDTTEEPHETFLVTLSNPTNAALADPQAVGLIRNDDGVAGKLDHFEWGPFSSPQTVFTPFPATLTAKDALGATVSNFNGTVEITASAGRSRPSTIVINEVDNGTTDQVEFLNVSSQTIDISRWQIAIYSATGWPAPRIVFALPNGTTCRPGEAFLLRQNTPSPGSYPSFGTGFTFGWSSNVSNNPIAVLLLDPAGYIVDFFCAVGADRARIVSPVPVPVEEWDGPPATANTSPTPTYQRIGNKDNHRATDWVITARSLGRVNTNQTIPYEEGRFLQIAPLAVNGFVEGKWQGNVTISEGASNVVLQANDGNGHRGVSNPIELRIVNDLAVNIEVLPDLPQMLREMTYRIVVTNTGPNASTSITITNELPRNVRIVSAIQSQGELSISSNKVVGAMGTLPKAGYATLDIKIVPLSTGLFTNSATVTRAEPDPQPGNNHSTIVTEVLGECAELASSVIGWWSGDGGGNDHAFSHHGVLTNGVQFQAGKVGLGFGFDGVDDAVLVPNDPRLNIGPGQDFSVEAWIKVPSGTTKTNLTIFDKRVVPDASTTVGFVLWLANGLLAAQIGDAPFAPNQFAVGMGGPDLRDGLFHHIALTVQRNTANGGTLYVDGNLARFFEVSAEAGDLGNEAPVRIGHAAFGEGYFLGVIDELVFYKSALTPQQVKAAFNAGGIGKCRNDVSLNIQYTSSATNFVGNHLSYTLHVRNSGATAATGVQLAHSLSPNLRLVSVVPSQGTVSNLLQNSTVNLGAIMPGGEVSVAITALVAQSGTVTNIATLTRSEEDPNLSNNQASAIFVLLPACVPLPSSSSLWAGEGDASDSGLGMNHGQLQNGVGFGVGKVGQSFKLDGLNDKIVVPSSPSLNFGANEDLTVEAWIRVDGNPGKEALTIIDKRNAPPVVDGHPYGGAVGYALILLNGTLTFGVGVGPLRAFNYDNFQASGPNLIDGKFHHVAVTVDRDSISGGALYVDGQNVRTFNPTGYAGDLSNDEGLIIGFNPTGTFDSYFRGDIDEPAVHRRALSAEEIRLIYQLGMRGYCAPKLDRDRDSLPDGWELDNGLSGVDAADALLDIDGDGHSNVQEFKAGTDPRSLTSALRLRVLSVSRTEVRLAFDSMRDKNYTLERCDNLQSQNWNSVGGIIIGNGGRVEIVDPLLQSGLQKFYRLRLSVP